MADDIKTFEDFWPYYVKAHSSKGNRRLHFVGTSAALLLAATGVLTRRARFLALAPVVGYGFAWVGHFFVEGNVPATFGHPLWSLKADFVMWKKILDGTMDAEVEKYTRTAPTNGASVEPIAAVANDTTVN